MTRRTYDIALTVTVTDPKKLFDAAVKNLISQGIDPNEARDTLTEVDDDSAPNIEECLRTLYDTGQNHPGTEIQDSIVERF